MSAVLLAAMPGQEVPARRLADALGVALAPIDVHRFPDGETRVIARAAAPSVLVYCTLDRPNEKLVELGLAASALRDLGARRLVLVAPYLCYMRQDAAFSAGEAVAQRVIGKLLASWFDRIVALEPHLHRTKSLEAVFPGAEASAVTAAPLLAALVRESPGAGALVVGPDVESESWTRAVAELVGAPFVVMSKVREGDARARVALPEGAHVAGRALVLVDDVISTGGTLAAASRLLIARGAASVEAVAAHALYTDENAAVLRAAGLERVRSTDSVPHPSNAISAAPALAAPLASEC